MVLGPVGGCERGEFNPISTPEDTEGQRKCRLTQDGPVFLPERLSAPIAGEPCLAISADKLTEPVVMTLTEHQVVVRPG